MSNSVINQRAFLSRSAGAGLGFAGFPEAEELIINIVKDQLTARFEHPPDLFRRADGIWRMLKQKTRIRKIKPVPFS